MEYKKLCDDYLLGYGLAVAKNPFVSSDIFKHMSDEVDNLLAYLEGLNVSPTEYVSVSLYVSRYLEKFVRLVDTYSSFDDLAFRVDEFDISVSLEFAEHLSVVLYECGTYLNNQRVFAGLTKEFAFEMNGVHDLYEFDLTQHYKGKVWVSKLSALILKKVFDGELLHKTVLMSYLDILVDYTSDRYKKLQDGGIHGTYEFTSRDMYIAYLELLDISSLIRLPYSEVDYE